MLVVVAATVAVAACGSKPREGAPPPEAEPEPAPASLAPAPPAPAARTRADAEWPTAPTRTITDRIGAVGFTLTLPNELQGHPDDRTDRSRGWEVPGWPLTQPRFEVTLRDEPAIATVEAGRDAYAEEGERVRTATLDGGRFTIVIASAADARPADAFVSAYVVIAAGAASLECFGTHGGAHLTDPDVIGPWLAAACGTLTLDAR